MNLIHWLSHLGTFRCRQCRHQVPYRRVVKSHYICLACYAHARGVHQRNEGKELLEREVDILLGGWTDFPWGSERMITVAQAEYLYEHGQCPQSILLTCRICQHYYRDDESGQDRTICQWCENELKNWLGAYQPTSKAMRGPGGRGARRSLTSERGGEE